MSVCNCRMGTAVLNVSTSGGGDGVRVYAHRTPPSLDVDGVTLMLLNLNVEPSQVTSALNAPASCTAAENSWRYTLTTGPDTRNCTSWGDCGASVLLNGKQLTFASKDSIILPSLDHVQSQCKRLTLPPHSVTWLVISPPTAAKTDDDYAEKVVKLTFLNSFDDQRGNPLAGLPALPKAHYSWPFPAGWPTLDASDPLLLDYARITHSLPVNLAHNALKSFTKPIVQELVAACAKVNASLALNWSPYITFCQPECRDPRYNGPKAAMEIEFFKSQLTNLTSWFAAAHGWECYFCDSRRCAD